MQKTTQCRTASPHGLVITGTALASMSALMCRYACIVLLVVLIDVGLKALKVPCVSFVEANPESRRGREKIG